nr:MAG TPA: hypothetical protein [Caudoviricetes sp.]
MRKKEHGFRRPRTDRFSPAGLTCPTLSFVRFSCDKLAPAESRLTRRVCVPPVGLVLCIQQMAQIRRFCSEHLAACYSGKIMVICYTTEGQTPTEYKTRR